MAGAAKAVATGGADVIRKTLTGFAVGAVMFAALGLYLNRAIGAAVLSHPGPVAMLALIGGTIGGLLAPLFGRRRRRRGPGQSS